MTPTPMEKYPILIQVLVFFHSTLRTSTPPAFFLATWEKQFRYCNKDLLLQF